MSSAPLDLTPFLMDYQVDTVGGDRTSQITIPEDTEITATLITRQPIVTAALELVVRMPEKLRLSLRGKQLVQDGVHVDSGATLGELAGDARQILGLERTLLNALQLLCGIATTTSQWAENLPKNVVLLDTRKTHPMLRSWERLAVRNGGGANHRFNLADTVIIKDNHIAAAGGILACVRRAAAECGHASKIICEVESVEGAAAAVEAGVHGLLIDNKPADQWPEYWQAIPEHVTLEFSGGIIFDDIQNIPEPPRQIHISTSQTVMGAKPVDIGLDIQPHD